jgi:hypothetical protein
MSALRVVEPAPDDRSLDGIRSACRASHRLSPELVRSDGSPIPDPTDDPGYEPGELSADDIRPDREGRTRRHQDRTNESSGGLGGALRAPDPGIEAITIEAVNAAPMFEGPIPLLGADFTDEMMTALRERLAALKAAHAHRATLCERLGGRPLSEIDASPPPALLLGRLDPRGHTILYGTGGAYKGVVAMSWMAQLVPEGHRVLLLDYEGHPEEWARRYAGLAGPEGAERILHVAPLASTYEGKRGPIWDCAPELADLAAEFGATYLVIDSVVPACVGADPTDPDTPARYTAALQYIGLPALSLAHVTKADDLRYPFGSIFWHNLARLTWSVARSGERAILTNRKANNYAKVGRFLVTVRWRDARPVEVLEGNYAAALAERIGEALGEDGLSVAAIVRRLNEAADEDEQRVKPDSVRAALRRWREADPPRYELTGTGDAAIWRRVP